MSKRFHIVSALAVLAVAGVFAASARASSLGLVSAPPDVYSDYVSVNYAYDSGTNTGVFTATGYAETLTLNNGATSISPAGNFSLSATFALSGTPGANETLTPTSASLSVTNSGGSTTYFASSSLQQFGFTTNADQPASTYSDQVFEFVFGPGSGTYGTSNQIGVILATPVNDPYAASFFDANFNNTDNNLYYSATSDTFAVPLPRAAYMGLVGLALLPLFLRRRRIARVAGLDS